MVDCMTPGEDEQLGDVSWNSLWVSHHEARAEAGALFFWERTTHAHMNVRLVLMQVGAEKRVCGWSPGTGSCSRERKEPREAQPSCCGSVNQAACDDISFKTLPSDELAAGWAQELAACSRATQHPVGCAWAPCLHWSSHTNPLLAAPAWLSLPLAACPGWPEPALGHWSCSSSCCPCPAGSWVDLSLLPYPLCPVLSGAVCFLPSCKWHC